MSQPTRVVRRPPFVFLAALVAVIALGLIVGRRSPAAGPRAGVPAAAGTRVSARVPPSLPSAAAVIPPPGRGGGEWQGMPIDPGQVALCDAVDACGLAMACIGGRCGACTGDDSCAPGETCALDHCVLAELASCRSRTDCGADELCVLGGTSPDPRGNAAMTARCVPVTGGIPDDVPSVGAGEPAGVVPIPAAELLEQVEADVRVR